MSPSFRATNSQRILARIRKRNLADQNEDDDRIPYTAKEFEADVHEFLNELFPFSVLPGVRLFDPTRANRSDLGCEMDGLLHFRFGGAEWIVIIEAKRQWVQHTGEKWEVKYGEQSKCARVQVNEHVQTLRAYLEPVAADRELKFLAVVVSSDPRTQAGTAKGHRNADLCLTTISELPMLLERRFNLKRDQKKFQPEILRVAQSEYLDLLRLSLPRPDLGHPEYTSALRYVERCRRSLDDTLFEKFGPTPERWVINGSAGMGKSVLLAYTAAVLSTGYELYRFQGQTSPKSAQDRLKKIGFDPGSGRVAIFTMSAKQLENLKYWFQYFVTAFQHGDEDGRVRIRPPQFHQCRSAGDLTPRKGQEWAAVLVDEAHDLENWAAKELAEQYDSHGFYLVVACDRHQKLRLTSANAKIVEGIDFQRKSTRLDQVYRNPAAVYIASLGLMFRWFAPNGPKVVPSKKQLENQFGFQVNPVGKTLPLVYQSDAHPANSWSHTIATFPNVNAAFTALAREKLSASEVLWVRFSGEDSSFDYEKLARQFTYHNCRSEEADKISDKYIKGQDYPVVAIEGFPSFMDRFETPQQEAKMWQFRRELYLCASRATCFLYLICNVAETAEIQRVKLEIERMMTDIACPNPHVAGARSWNTILAVDEFSRPLSVFDDTAPDAEEIAEEDPSESNGPIAADAQSEPVLEGYGEEADGVVAEESFTLEVDGNMTVAEFSQAMELPQPEIEEKLLDLGYVLTGETTLDLKAMKRVGAEWNTTVTLAGDSLGDEDTEPAEESDLVPASCAEKSSLAAVNPPSALPEIAPERIRGVVDLYQDAKEESQSAPGTSKSESGAKRAPDTVTPKPKDSPEVIEVRIPIVVRDLAEAIGIKPFTMIVELMELDVFANQNQSIEPSVAREICKKHGFTMSLRKSGKGDSGAASNH